MQQTSPAENTRNLLPTGDSPWTTSSPHYPKGHGFIERQVKTIKKMFARCDEDSTNYYLALQELWATPINSNLQSPAELLFSRQLKTTLPAIIWPPHNSEAVRASLKARQDYSRYDAHSKEKPDLLPTQPIWVQDTISKKWNPGVVKSQAEIPHSYIIQTPQGEYRRNHLHLKEAAIPTTSSRVSEYNLQY